MGSDEQPKDAPQPIEAHVHWAAKDREMFEKVGKTDPKAQKWLMDRSRAMEAAHTQRSQEFAPLRQTIERWQPFFDNIGAPAPLAIDAYDACVFVDGGEAASATTTLLGNDSVNEGSDSQGPRSMTWLDEFWRAARAEAGLRDVRLHDLRHTHASHAVMNGVPVPVVSRLLGHADVGMTLRYAHLGDRDIERAAERVGQAVADLMGW